jgi:hypothetical protein
MAAGLKFANLPPLTLTANTPQVVQGQSLSVYSAIIVAEATNVGNIFVGDSGVTPSTGVPIEPGNTLTLAVEGAGRFTEFDLTDLFVTTNTTGNIARISVFKRKV